MRKRNEGTRRWHHAEPWRDWLRRSPVGVELFTRSHEARDYLELLGEEAYRAQALALLSRARRRDCAAAGLGCSRRLDRSCQAPEVCAADPAGPLTARGPAPGGCDSYWWSTDARTVTVYFTADDRHRAILWYERQEGVRLWVDGTAAGADQTLDTYGRWLDDRFFVVGCEGPQDHPAQEYTMGSLVSTIQSVLVHDAGSGTTRVFEPGPDERWTDPTVRRRDNQLLIFADRQKETPDRVIS
ncbi:hypothetical protein [Actinoplanes sp. DH11]|uniref:hypothetical protein n=1 Tax=Actinoplanes sp. DH11 TaxID=2857011 RepID=UPI001E492DF2|nr:hypothetical protein [Actinoplanes sp. DH11]